MPGRSRAGLTGCLAFTGYFRVSLATATTWERASPGAEGSSGGQKHLMHSLHLDHRQGSQQERVRAPSTPAPSRYPGILWESRQELI